MLINPDPTATTSNPPSAATLCGNCGVSERRLLHHVRHRGIFRRLCTSCVLRAHPQSFCPTCFQIYPPPPPNDAVLTCFKCYSSTHSMCVAAPSSPYICPLCVSPGTPIFKLKETSDPNYKAMDRDMATKLLAAAKIATASMHKAAAAAKAEAERRAKEAAFTRKRAKEALEHVGVVVAKEASKKKDGGVRTEGGSGVRSGNFDSSNKVLAALNAVELRENEKNELAEEDDGLVISVDDLEEMLEERDNDSDSENLDVDVKNDANGGI